MAHVFKSEAARRQMYEQLGRFTRRDEFYREYDASGGAHPALSNPSVVDDLKRVRATLHLRWNMRAVATADGEFEGRWEIWDVTPQDGERYLVRSIYKPIDQLDEEGQSLGVSKEYREPSQQDVDFFRAQDRLFQKYDGDMEKVIDEMVDAENLARENSTEEDAAENIGRLLLEGAQYEVPKSYAGQLSRGQRAFSGK